MVQRLFTDMMADRLDPATVTRIELQLSALAPNIAAERRKCGVDYKRILLTCYTEEKTANRAKLVAETMPEWARYEEAKDLERLVQEAIRTLRSAQRSMDAELRLQR